MKRWLGLLLALALVAGGLWLGGRAPSDYVLQRECERYQEERDRAYAQLDSEVARLRDPAAVKEARAKRDALLRAHKRLEMRGWEVLLIPAGATRPDSGDFLRGGRFDPKRATHVALRGEIEVWYAPRGAVARMLFKLRLTP